MVVNTTPTVGGGMQLPNPIHTHEAAEAVMAAVGFPSPAPDPPAGFSGVHWRGEAGSIRVAVWATEGFIHSLRSTEGLTESQLRPMIAATLPE